MGSSNKNALAVFAVDELKIIACVLLVFYHVIGSDPALGLKLDYPSVWRIFVDALNDVRMPAFALISGCLYALRPVGVDGFAQFVKGKFARIYLPALFAAVFFYSVYFLVFGRASSLLELLKLPFFHYVHYWYVQAIMVLLLIAGLMDCWRVRGWAIVAFVLSCVVFLSDLLAGVKFLSLSGAAYLAPYFFLGVLCSQYVQQILSWRKLLLGVLALVSVVCAILLYREYLSHQAFLNDRRDGLGLIAGMVFPLLLMLTLPRWQRLKPLVKYTFFIYLYHVLFTAGSRVFLEKLGVDSLVVFIVAGLMIGFFGPIIMFLVLERCKLFPRILLGLKA